MVIISLNATLAGFCAIGVAGILWSSKVEILPHEHMSTVGTLLFVVLPVHLMLACLGWLRSRMRFPRLLQRSIVVFCTVMTDVNMAIASGSLNAVSWYARNPGARILVFALSSVLWLIQSVAWLLIHRRHVVESPAEEPTAALAPT